MIRLQTYNKANKVSYQLNAQRANAAFAEARRKTLLLPRTVFLLSLGKSDRLLLETLKVSSSGVFQTIAIDKEFHIRSRKYARKASTNRRDVSVRTTRVALTPLGNYVSFDKKRHSYNLHRSQLYISATNPLKEYRFQMCIPHCE